MPHTLNSRLHATLIGASAVIAASGTFSAGVPALGQLVKSEVPAKGAAPTNANARTDPLDLVRDEASRFAKKKAALIERLKSNAQTAPIQGEVRKLRIERARLEALRLAVPFPAAQVVPAVQATTRQQQFDALFKRWTLQLRPVLRVEYHFVRNLCTLTKEQRIQIARDGERLLQELALECAEAQSGGSQAGVIVIRHPQESRNRLQACLVKSLKSHVSVEQADRYQAELTRRNAYFRRAALDNLVVKLDEDLALADEQREKISESLAAHWDEAWCSSFETVLNLNAYFPPIPDSYVVRFLTPKQRQIWDASANTRRTVQFGVSTRGLMEEDPLEDEELTEARKTETPAETIP